MLESSVGELEKAEGIAQVEDFGSVHSGRLGYADCETRLALETWKNVYFVRGTVIQTKGRGMKIAVSINVSECRHERWQMT